MAGPPFLPGGVPETEGFRRPGAPEKKICRGAQEGKETEESSEALGHQRGKYVMVPRKLCRAGHQQENCTQMPAKAVKWV